MLLMLDGATTLVHNMRRLASCYSVTCDAALLRVVRCHNRQQRGRGAPLAQVQQRTALTDSTRGPQPSTQHR